MRDGPFFLFAGGDLLVDAEARPFDPLLAEGFAIEDDFSFPWEGGTARARSLARGSLPPGALALPARRYLLDADSDEARPFFRALGLLVFRSTMRHCPLCGRPLEEGDPSPPRVCRPCGREYFPRICPAVAVAVRDGDRLLLARNAKFANGIHSLVAGFVETGETLEETCVREVQEETGILIGRPRYAASQPWPFPDSLMLGFEAERVGGELRPDGVEIVEAGFFGPGELPPLPGRGSLSRALIDRFVESFTA